MLEGEKYLLTNKPKLLNTMVAHQLCQPRPFGAFGTQFYAISLPQHTKKQRNKSYDAALALAKSDALNQKLKNESKRNANKRIETL